MDCKVKLATRYLRTLISEEIQLREQDADEDAREKSTDTILKSRRPKPEDAGKKPGKPPKKGKGKTPKKGKDKSPKEDETDGSPKGKDKRPKEDETDGSPKGKGETSKEDETDASKKGGGKRVKKVKKKKSKIKVSQNLVNKVKGLSEKDVERIVKRMAKDQKRKNKIKELEAALEVAKNPAADVAADAAEKVEAETKAENPSVEKAADSSPVDKKGLKSLSQGTINTALNQLRNKGVSADKFQKTVVAAIKDIYKGAGPQRDNFAKSDAPIIKKISNEIGKILKGDFSNLVRESEDAIMVHSVTHNIIEALAKESKCDKEKRNV